MERPDIELMIDEIKLSGFTNIDEVVLQTALEEELRRLLYEENYSSQILQSFNGCFLNRQLLTLEPNSSSEELGKKIASWLVTN